MSDTQVQETEVVHGQIMSVTVKGQDKWTVQVRPPGSNYDKNLWTKNAELVASLASEIGSAQTFQCDVSKWQNNEGAWVRSLWIRTLGGEVAAPAVAAPSPGPHYIAKSGLESTSQYQRDPSPESQKRMDQHQLRHLRGIAWVATAELFGGTLSAETPHLNTEQELRVVFSHFQFFQRLVLSDIAGDLLTAQEAEAIPFGAVMDPESVPFD